MCFHKYNLNRSNRHIAQYRLQNWCNIITSDSVLGTLYRLHMDFDLSSSGPQITHSLVWISDLSLANYRLLHIFSMVGFCLKYALLAMDWIRLSKGILTYSTVATLSADRKRDRVDVYRTVWNVFRMQISGIECVVQCLTMMVIMMTIMISVICGGDCLRVQRVRESVSWFICRTIWADLVGLHLRRLSGWPKSNRSQTHVGILHLKAC